ncbi:hypothetical protein [Marinomonas mediterranea]|uniref:hypothetical protein n=1 Tax=Marinomonas mediterranea TaxID=119864 RepID=UPI00234AB46D|nr:hypothetical protein [Marinomonas mediterranea]WCN09336.1 hypothetical protein GV055_10555 [Marinomonas mediterranea]
MNTAMDRWIVGHHLFIVTIQGIILCLLNFEDNIKKKQLGLARKELLDASKLLSASASSMKLASSFSKKQYLDVIRPSMPDNFSGLDMVDHKEMINVMKRIKPFLLSLPKELYEAKDIFNKSLSQAYDMHIYVCDQFVEDESSLRAVSSQASATEALSKIKKQRLKNIGENDSHLSPKQHQNSSKTEVK